MIGLVALPVVIRDREASDVAFVADSWFRSHRHGRDGDPWAAAVPIEAYAEIMRARMHTMLTTSQLRLCCFDEDPSLILGLACVRGDLVHYVYVRPQWRRKGIASTLLTDLVGHPARYSHATRHHARVPIDWTYKPGAME